MLMPPAPIQSLAVTSESRKPNPKSTWRRSVASHVRLVSTPLTSADLMLRVVCAVNGATNTNVNPFETSVSNTAASQRNAPPASDDLKPISYPLVSSWSYESRTPCGRPGTPAATNVATPTATPLKLKPPLRNPSAYVP